MNPSAIFSFGNSFVLIGWILLLAIPNWKHTQTLVLGGVVFVLSIIYAFVLISGLGSFSLDSFSTLENVKKLFSEDQAVALGWVHYLAFDLFVGAYIVRKSQELGISRWLYSLALPFTFMFGPVGYLIFLIIKTIKTKTWNF